METGEADRALSHPASAQNPLNSPYSFHSQVLQTQGLAWTKLGNSGTTSGTLGGDSAPENPAPPSMSHLE